MLRGWARKMTNWLETRWVTPAYAGGLLGFLTLFFFGAATNTMAGWLYVISGMGLAVLLAAAILPARSLVPLKVRRHPIAPVSVGDPLTVEVDIDNPSRQPRTLLQVVDRLPPALGEAKRAIEAIAPGETYRWSYSLPTRRRGIYHWPGVRLRTAAPLGLFWCSRDRDLQATAIVYPTVLPLASCPLLDAVGDDSGPQIYERDRLHLATEGMTRTLRPYRYGDPTRLIHWRSSARYGELRVRELEVAIQGQDIAICLDSAFSWDEADFETAVSVAASLYFYASRAQYQVQLWTAKTGLVRGNWTVLGVLAGVAAGETQAIADPPNLPLIWITQNPETLATLPPRSRWLLWPAGEDFRRDRLPCPGIAIDSTQPLIPQLQSPPI